VEKKKGVKVEEKVDESYSETGSEISDPSAIDQASISDGSETPSSSQEGKGPSKAEKEPPAKVTKKVSKNEKGIFSKKESKRESIKEDKEHRKSLKKKRLYRESFNYINNSFNNDPGFRAQSRSTTCEIKTKI